MENQEKVFGYLKRATAELQETRKRLRRMEAREEEPIAIVGMGCRFPGDVRDPEGLWDLVASGTDAIAGFPDDRGWDAADKDVSYLRAGGFVYDAAEFDAGFFGISPREALAMDPQQRLLLEVTWEALEEAGVNPQSLRGSRTGVFAGAAFSGYSAIMAGGGGSEGYLLTGSVSAVISGRVSYVLGLEGPAMTVDTACSSSLVALHLACQALRSGECTLALASGVAVMVVPGAFAEFSRQQGMAADGRCKAFAGAADGIGWGEGAGVLVLEKLSDARRNGHRVHALIRGSAVNQDGASNGLTAPNGPSQQRVIRDALASARLSAAAVDAVEGHGTGTTLGDPIEAQALIATYGQDRPDGRPLWLGSVKSNIGHAQCAAGVAGVLKMVLALKHGALPRTLHVDEPSPHIDWSAGDVRLLTEAVPWPADAGRPRRAGVSAFGVGGTNAHIILEEAPAAAAEDVAVPAAGHPPVLSGPGGPAGGPVAWPVSGKSAAALAVQAGRLTRWLTARPGLEPADVSWSLATGRAAFGHRAVVIGSSPEELTAGLAAVAGGQPSAGVVTGSVPAGGDPGKVVFVFPGQGAQWAGMGRELAAASPVFAARLAECSAALAPFTGWRVEDVLAGVDGAPSLERVDVLQPALWAVMVSLAAVWQAAGVVPDAVAGHSQGEIAAAVVAGVLSLPDAARVVALRSRALRALAGRGAMASVAAPAGQVRERLGAGDGRLSVAAVNGPSATVVSGAADAVAALVAAYTADGIRARVLPVDYASHGPQVEDLEQEILTALDGLTPRRADIPVLSAMTGQYLHGPDADAAYWYASLRAPVEFERSIRALAADGHRVFIEVSPHPVLTAPIAETLEEAGTQATVTGTLRRDDGGQVRLLVSLAEAHVHGVRVDWAALRPAGQRVDLPIYAFQGQHYWADPIPAPTVTGGGGAGTAGEARFWAAVEGGNLHELAQVLALDGERPFSEVLPVLASWRRRERDGATLADWRYRVSWVPVPVPVPVRDAGPAVLSGTWLLVVPDTHATPVAAAIAAAMTAGGARLITIKTQDSERTALTAREDMAALVRETLAGEILAGDTLAGVVSLLALDEAPLPRAPAVPAGLAGTLTLIQALGDAAVEAPLWVLTSGAVGALPGEAPARPVQAMAWGLGRTAGVEHPGRWGGLVDVPAVAGGPALADGPALAERPALDDRTASRLCTVLAGCGEEEVALRPAGVFGRRLVRAPSPVVAGDWRPRGTVLVTGAGGAIGPDLARWLAGRGADRVVLAGRRGPMTPGAAAVASGLAGAGTAVRVAVCDVTDRAQAAGLLAWAGSGGRPVSTVVHGAVAVDLKPVADTTVADLGLALGAKAGGAAVLDALTAGSAAGSGAAPPEADGRGVAPAELVLFSSIAATWGVAEHGTYAAANAYLDALAESRRGRGLPATSVAWGVWSSGGRFDAAAADDGRSLSLIPERLARQGLRLLDPARALTALGQVLAAGETVTAVADVDWERFAPVFTAARQWRLLERIPRARPRTAGPAATEAVGGLTAELAGLDPAERERLVTALVRTQAAAVLGFADARGVEPDRAFRDMGFDSLTAIELRNGLNAATGLTLPSTVVFDYPSPAALARQVSTQLMSGPGSTGPGAAAALPGAAVSPITPGEPVAIVGLGCRYPGGADTPEALWELLAAGRDAVGRFPVDRGWDTVGLFDPDPSNPGTSYTSEGGFVPGAGDFDPAFFGISPREALAMDPQQRLLLEVSWEALERAGLNPQSLRGSRTGVFAGAAASGYAGQVMGIDGTEGHLITGNVTSVISGRISYALGLEGPAVTVDTACSSALVAMHLAWQSLRAGECDLALAGGVMVIADPAEFIGFSRQRALAADGRCKAFAASADGMGLAEGAGMIALERLSDARRNGHRVLAVIAGSAINSDGASNGLSAPNGPSQQRVIAAALASGGLSPSDIDAVEGHGTGTTLGDPIEAQALIAAYGQDRPAGRPLWLGSVKSNIGHAQQAAGAVAVIKMALALVHGELPPTLHVDQPTPHVDWSAGDVRLLTEAVPWPAAAGRPRRAGISAFGISGTNAHIIIEEPPAIVEDPVPVMEGDPAEPAPEIPPVLTRGTGVFAWPLAGKSPEALAGQAGKLAAWIAARPDLDPAAVGWSLASARPVFEHRAVVVGAGPEDLAAGLSALAAGRPSAGVVSGSLPAGGDAGPVVFVFPGQGGQWAGMGRDLAAASPVFAARLAECSAALQPFTGWPVEDMLADSSALERVDVVQPALWAVMVSLAAVWEAAGVRPAAVAGHSQGEIAAAVVAGILSLADAARVVALRSRALTALAGRGGMASMALPARALRERLGAWDGRLSVAAVNSPDATVVSGDPEAITELVTECEGDGIRARVLPVDYASHGPQVEELKQEILAALDGLEPRSARIPMISAMTGEWLDGHELDAGYWYASLRSPVEFQRSVEVLARDGYGVFIETSPHPVLTAAIAETADDAVAIGTLRRDDGGPARLLAALAQSYAAGVPVRWTRMQPPARSAELPTYAFQHQHYWPAPRVTAGAAGDVTAAGLGAVGHPLLSAVVELAADGGGLVCTGRMSLPTQPWLGDHVVAGLILLPATAYVELALGAGNLVGCDLIEELTLQAPLVLPVDGAIALQVIVSGAGQDGQRTVEVHARLADTEAAWTRHASGVLASAGPRAALDRAGEFMAWPPADAVPADITGLYEGLAAGGCDYGPAFRGLRAAWRRGPETFAEVALPEGTAASAFGLHPALLDAALHALLLSAPPASSAEGTAAPGGLRMPFAWTGVTRHSAGPAMLRVRLRLTKDGGLSLAAADAGGLPVMSVTSLVLRPVTAEQLRPAPERAGDLFKEEWIKVPVPAGGELDGRRWAVVGADWLGLSAGLTQAGVQVTPYPDLAALGAAIMAGAPAPAVVLAGAGAAAGEPDAAAMARRVTGQVLGLIQDWLASEPLAEARLMIVTRGAVTATADEGITDLGAAAAWGLVRSAQSENPDRLTLVDLPVEAGRADTAEANPADANPAVAVAVALLVAALNCAEPAVAIRGQEILARRLARLAPLAAKTAGLAGTVLVTGGTGMLGGLVATHLAATGRADRLVLASRSGPAAPGVAELAAEVAAAGADVQVSVCDAGDAEALAGLLHAIAAECPLTGVIHTAGVLADGVIESLTQDRIDSVMRAKADAAWNLHRLTSGVALRYFVLFSSGAGTFGAPGQGNYAAANAFLDALAAYRKTAGLPGISLAWGAWVAGAGIGRHLSAGMLARITHSGTGELSAADGLALFDLALAQDAALLIPARLDLAELRARAAAGEEMPPLLRGLTGGRRRPAPPEGTHEPLRQQLAGMSRADQDRALTGLIRAHAAAICGHASPEAVEPGRPFTDLGFDSLMAVEMRNQLRTVTGLKLSATLVFDYPTPAVLARYLQAELAGVLAPAPAVPVPPVPAAEAGEPIAIVGIGCRFPGGVDSPEGLWELLATGGDAISGLPEDRGWDTGGLYDPDPDRAGTSYAREGGFVHGAAEFDPAFFGISPREALAMDPQQRLLLETAWEAIERAGIDPASLRGTVTGVFAGASSWGYGAGAVAGIEGSEGYLMMGNAISVVSGRVSYALGLEGPAVSVDTACSSALVALHLACQALRAGECSLALAGGVTIMATPGAMIGFSRQRGLAADGRCKAFAAAADGMGMGEGAGMIAVERLSDARRHGHRVLAVIAGSAVNQDGASNGLTAPNGPSQQRVIRAALASARLSADQIDAVEAHGTGTTLGDPIEAQALLATYGQGRPAGLPLWLGSVKSNIGHAQAASGAAGVIKMVLALQHGLLPLTLHVDEPSPHVDWSAGDVRLLTEPVPWRAGHGRPRRAGISAFGISGTNAHLILQEPPAEDTGSGDEAAAVTPGGSTTRLAAVPLLVPEAGSAAWLVSGKTADARAGQAERLARWVASRPALVPAAVAWSLATARSVFEHRAVVIGAATDELAAGLSALAAGRPSAAVVAGSVPPGGDAGQTVFVFPGQGGQWAGMGRDLAAVSPVFAARLAECSAALQPFTGWLVEDVLADSSALGRVDVVQPALWAVMVSLAAVWEAAGVRPDAVAGHSQGEIAAAVVAGVLSLEDGARVVALRSRALTALAGRGGMASIAEPAAMVRQRLAAWNGRLSVAAVNGPDATVVSGDGDAIAALVAGCAADGVRARALPVDYASHGPQVEALAAEITAALAGVVPGPARVPMISAMTGEWLRGPELDAGYWYRSLRAPVEFARSVRLLAGSGHRAFVEVSPHPVLTTGITATVEAAGEAAAVVTGTLRRDDGGAARLLASLAAAYVAGVSVDWTRVIAPAAGVELPTYAFQRQHYWPRPAAAAVVGTVVAGGDGAAADTRFWAAVEGGDLQGLADALAVDGQRPFSEVMPVLASWRRRARADSAVADWRYRVTWVPVPDADPGQLSGTWLLVVPADRETAADAIAAAMTACGAQVIEIKIDTKQPERTVVAARIADVTTGGVTLSGAVSLLAHDEGPLPDAPGVPAGTAGTLALLQGLGDAGAQAPLWVLTSGAVGVVPAEAPVRPVQAMVWGLGRVAALEHPDRWGGLVDLPPGLDPQAARRLCAVLAGRGEDQVAIRAAGSYARRMIRAAEARATKAWAPGGSALITGGTGAIGGHVAHWLASRSTPRVILTSRSGPAAPGVALLAAELAVEGTTVQVSVCDSASRYELAGLLARTAASGPPLAAVFHAAGVPQATTIADMTTPGLAGVLAAKTEGAACLDELTRDTDLEAFVLFSSGAAVWGSGQQAGYAAANAYLDALAETRRAQGLPATSTAWAAWGGGGMTSPQGAVELQRRGLAQMDPQLAIRALAQILDADEAGITIADIDWARFTPAFTVRRPSPLLSALPEAVQALAQDTAPAAGAAVTTMSRQLDGLPRAEQDRILTDLVRAQVAAVLGHSSTEAIEPGRAFRDLGFDSLAALELRNSLAVATGVKLPATLIYDYPSPTAVAEYLWAEQFSGGEMPLSLSEELDKFESLLSQVNPDDSARALVNTRLAKILSMWDAAVVNDGSKDAAQKIASATDDEIFSFINMELGREEM